MTSASGSTVWKPTTNEWNQYIKFFFSELSYISGVKTAVSVISIGHSIFQYMISPCRYGMRWGGVGEQRQGSDIFLSYFHSHVNIQPSDASSCHKMFDGFHDNQTKRQICLIILQLLHSTIASHTLISFLFFTLDELLPV